MDKWLFIEVQTYQSVNNMGKELGQYVFERYDQTVVHGNCMDSIEEDIAAKLRELEEKYPRCKPFQLFVSKHVGRYGEAEPDISVGPVNKFNDNLVFILHTKYIRKMNLETSLNF